MIRLRRSFITVLTLLVVATSNPGEAQSVLKPGYYTGVFKCTYDGKKYSEIQKFRVEDGGGGLTDMFDMINGYAYTSSTETSDTFTRQEFPLNVYDDDGYPDICEGQQSLTITKRGEITLFGSGQEFHTWPVHTRQCTGKLTFTSERNNITVSGEVDKVTSCYNVSKPTRLQWGFEDSGGFYALFKLSALSCNGSGRKTLYSFSKYTETASKAGNVTLPRGKWRLQGKSTGYWWVEGMPGVK